MEWVRATLLQHAGELMARRTLQPFFDAQLVVAEQLVSLGEEPAEKEAFLDACLGYGHQLALQGRVKARDSVSKELYAAAFELAGNRGLVETGAADLRSEREAFLAEVVELRSRLALLAAIEEEAHA